MTRLIYHESGSESAKRLAAFMGIVGSQEIPKSEERPKWLIRWGTQRKVPLAPALGVINSSSALARQTNRINHLYSIQLAGVRVPRVWAGFTGNGTFPIPVLGRQLKGPHGEQTAKGAGIVHYPAGTPVGKHAFFVEYIPKVHEFRVDVVAHKTRVRELTPKDPSAIAWNTDGVFNTPSIAVPSAVSVQAAAAVKALGLDFGAVDTILTPQGEVVVLEVNTAPELTNPTLEWYAKAFAWMTGMDASKMPGWSAVPKIPTTGE